ncbi:MAG: diacylglycerol kinase, partial [Methylophilaceae bacterium]|nr:diacylglycerol kinase [Methylophilaceae bacterium]
HEKYGKLMIELTVKIMFSFAAALLLATFSYLVIIVELLNSSVEATVDRISLDHHLLAKRAKDIGSAAVLLSLINLFVVWLLILWPN